MTFFKKEISSKKFYLFPFHNFSLVFLLTFLGCGIYSFNGSIPPHINTISIPLFLKIKFRMQDDHYQEILNIRDFGIDDLWGNIGGYVGMFCGYSILQMTTTLIKNVMEVVMAR